ATPAAASSAEPAKSVAEPAAAAKSAATPTAAERPHAARPAAPSAASPMPNAAARTAAIPAQDNDQNEDAQDPRDRNGAYLRSKFARHLDTSDLNVASLGDAPDDSRRSQQQTLAIAALTKFGRHDHARRFARESIGDEFFEPVADFDPDATFFYRDQNEQPVVLALLADAASVVLEQFRGVFADVAVRFDGWNSRDHHDVSAGIFQRADLAIHFGFAFGVDDVREIVHRFGERRKRGGRCVRRNGRAQQANKEESDRERALYSRESSQTPPH